MSGGVGGIDALELVRQAAENNYIPYDVGDYRVCAYCLRPLEMTDGGSATSGNHENDCPAAKLLGLPTGLVFGGSE